MLPAVKSRSAATFLLGTVVAAAAFWAYASQPRRTTVAGAPIPIQDGRTIDFSNGRAKVGENDADKAAMDAAVKEMDAASKDITFPAEPAPKK
jgi:hypothetical protein